MLSGFPLEFQLLCQRFCNGYIHEMVNRGKGDNFPSTRRERPVDRRKRTEEGTESTKRKSGDPNPDGWEGSLGASLRLGCIYKARLSLSGHVHRRVKPRWNKAVISGKLDSPVRRENRRGREERKGTTGVESRDASRGLLTEFQRIRVKTGKRPFNNITSN